MHFTRLSSAVSRGYRYLLSPTLCQAPQQSIRSSLVPQQQQQSYKCVASFNNAPLQVHKRCYSADATVEETYQLLQKVMECNGTIPFADESILISDEVITEFCKSYIYSLSSDDKVDFLLHMSKEFGKGDMQAAATESAILLSKSEQVSYVTFYCLVTLRGSD